MIARTIKMVWLSADVLCSDEGWQAPDGWRIVNSEFSPRVGEYRVTLVKS